MAAALAVDVEEALLEYFALFYNLGFADRTLRRMGVIEFVTTNARFAGVSVQNRMSSSRVISGKPRGCASSSFENTRVDTPAP